MKPTFSRMTKWSNYGDQRIFIMRIKTILFFYLGISLISASALLSTARAESWVLWEKKEYFKTSMEQNIFWEIIDAYPEYKQCLQGMQKVWQMTRDQAIEDKKNDTISEVKEIPDTGIITRFKQPKEIMSISYIFYCLPGTLDPREKK